MIRMQKIPLEAREIKRFTPPALADVEDPPVFVLKAISRREKARFDDELVEAGIRSYAEVAFRSEMLKALPELYDEQAANDAIERLKDFWQIFDDWKEAPEDEREPEFSHPDQQPLNDLIARLYDNWHPLRQMEAANNRYSREHPLLLMAVTIDRAENVAVPLGRQNGILNPEDVAEMIEWLAEAFPDSLGIKAGAELYLECLGRIYLLADTEKNSASPPSSTPAPNDSKAQDDQTADGKSPASDNSTATPENSSTPNAGD